MEVKRVSIANILFKVIPEFCTIKMKANIDRERRMADCVFVI